MKITESELAQLAELRKRRDHAAFMIGVATVEWRRHVVAAEALIMASEGKERLLGADILRAHGLDPEKGDYQIRDDGHVVELFEGTYIDAAEPDTTVDDHAI